MRNHHGLEAAWLLACAGCVGFSAIYCSNAISAKDMDGSRTITFLMMLKDSDNGRPSQTHDPH